MKNSDFEIGDKIILVHEHTRLTLYKEYAVFDVFNQSDRDNLILANDDGFLISVNRKYFINNIEYRKVKLEKINNQYDK